MLLRSLPPIFLLLWQNSKTRTYPKKKRKGRGGKRFVCRGLCFLFTFPSEGERGREVEECGEGSEEGEGRSEDPNPDPTDGDTNPHLKGKAAGMRERRKKCKAKV